jgi:Big-like domain-containing protein
MSKRGAPYGRVPVVVGLIAFMVVGVLSFTSPTVVRAAPGDVGQAGPSFAGSGADPTGTKPEAKIWFNDGFWWASMYRATASAYTIHRLSGTTWTDTGVVIDDRENTHSDALWDQTAGKLYIASHVYTTSPSNGNNALLYRYSYNAGADTYALDSGFPQTINTWSSETLVIDKDSSGQLWATWTRGNSVRVNRTTNGDQTWGTEFVPAVSGTSNGSDDISTLVAFGGNKIGLLWSNQSGSPDSFFFSVHDDNATDTTWGASTAVYPGNNFADDHLNLKADPAGNLFAVVKTSLGAGQPNLVVLRRSAAGTWTNQTYSTGQGTMTRGVLAVDTTNNLLHVFATAPESNGTIYEKTSPLSSLSFASGLGTPFIRDNSQDDLNNATTAKGTVNSTTGLLVLAGHETLNEYWFNVDPLGGGGGPTPTPTPGGSTITLNPTEDAQVRLTAPTTNYGSLTTFRTREEATGETYRSYVKFNVSGITGTVNSVKLRLFATDESSNVQTVASVDPNAWAENTLNWNNKPAFGTVRGSGAVPTLTAYNEITLSPAMITGNGAISIGIQSAGTNSAIFTSSEGGANLPQLVITQTVASGPPPTANPSSQSTLQGQPVTFDLTGSDVDTCGLTFAISVAPTKGAVSTPNSAPGCTVGSPNTDSASVTYTPSPASTGADQFTFTVSDGVNPPVSAVVSLTIGARPTANAGSASTPEDTAASVILTGGDLETCDLTFAFTQPAHGTVSSLVDNACAGPAPFTDSATVTYMPVAGYNGPDSFTFTTNDGSATSASATISLTVGTPPDAPPTANPVTTSTAHVAKTITLSGSDPDDCQLSFLAPVDAPEHGTLGVVTDAGCVAGSPNTDSATVVYTPAAGYVGPDSFTYSVTDGTTPSTATVSITVTNAAPTANGSSQTTLQGTPKTFDLTGTDADDCTLTFAIVASPTKGNVSAPVAGPCTPGSPNTDRASVTYTPGAGQTGADSFTFTVSDGVSTSAAATVNLTITPSGGTPTTFTPIADSKVKSDSPSNNYGTLTQMQTRAAAPTTPTIWRPYMRFNVTGSGTVTGVKIRLWVDTGSPDGGTVYAAVDSAWTDTSITWNNAPAPGAALGALGSTSAKVGTWVEVDLGAGAVTGNGTYTFVIQTTSSTSGQLSSKEGAHPPELVVTRSP